MSAIRPCHTMSAIRPCEALLFKIIEGTGLGGLLITNTRARPILTGVFPILPRRDCESGSSDEESSDEEFQDALDENDEKSELGPIPIFGPIPDVDIITAELLSLSVALTSQSGMTMFSFFFTIYNTTLERCSTCE